MAKYLCLDPGASHTGIALSEEGELATPHSTIFEKDLNVLIGKLVPLIASVHPDTIVIGIPSFGPIIILARELKEKLTPLFSGDIVLYDEDLSSRRSQKHITSKQKEHQTAAAFILQDYLDSL